MVNPSYRISLLTAFFAATLIDSPALAQTSNEACISIGEAFRLAATRAPNFRVASARVNEASADVTQARSLFQPRVSGFGR